MKSGNANNGLVACEEALQRLLDGKPIVPEHVRLDLSKLTASIVSLEAGFDRGYLKKSRRAHLPLLARIQHCRAENNKALGASNTKIVESLKYKLSLREKELEVVRARCDRVLTQNLQLWERVRELEVEKMSKSLQVRQHH